MVVRSTLPVGQTFVWHRLALPTKIRSYPGSGSSSPAPEELVKVEDASSAMKVEASNSFVTSQAELEMNETTWNGPTTATTTTTTTVTSTSSTVKLEEHAGAAVDTAVSTLPELPLDISSTSFNLLEDTSLADLKVEDMPESIVAVPPAQRNPEEQEQAYEQEIDDLEEDEPLEEYSRAIPDPDRVVLLRQTKTKIWIVSVLPDSADERGNEIDGIIKGKAEREERDKAWFADYFQLPNLSPGASSSVPMGNLEDHPAEPPTGESRPRAPPLPLPLMDQYAHWKALDPLLFGKAYDRDELPKGVRVVRQEGWECLVS